MKLLKLNQRAVKAYGIDWLVPEDARWLAVDKDGDVNPYYNEPYANEFYGEYWGDEFYACLGKVDLEGADWEKTLVYIGKDKHNALLDDGDMGFNHD